MLEPMNPYERRIIHSEVQKIEGVSTNSIGSENNRKIVMFLDEKGAAMTESKTAAPRSESERSERPAGSKPRRRRPNRSSAAKNAAPEKKNAPIDDTFTDPFLVPDLTGASEEYDREEAAKANETVADEPRSIEGLQDL
jgi:hypothetical protein